MNDRALRGSARKKVLPRRVQTNDALSALYWLPNSGLVAHQKANFEQRAMLVEVDALAGALVNTVKVPV
ncbi:MAG: hypothetical protein NVS4B7_08780 [Ktedonobacteraceae bacterium]